MPKPGSYVNGYTKRGKACWRVKSQLRSDCYLPLSMTMNTQVTFFIPGRKSLMAVHLSSAAIVAGGGSETTLRHHKFMRMRLRNEVRMRYLQMKHLRARDYGDQARILRNRAWRSKVGDTRDLPGA